MSSRKMNKALLIPINAKREIFIQDRAGHKPPPWGFFGGEIEAGETALQAVIRETKEELAIDLTESELIDLGDFPTSFGELEVERHIFLWLTEQTEFTVLEGAGGAWLSHDEAKDKLSHPERFDKIWSKIEEVV